MRYEQTIERSIARERMSERCGGTSARCEGTSSRRLNDLMPNASISYSFLPTAPPSLHPSAASPSSPFYSTALLVSPPFYSLPNPSASPPAATPRTPSDAESPPPSFPYLAFSPSSFSSSFWLSSSIKDSFPVVLPDFTTRAPASPSLANLVHEDPSAEEEVRNVNFVNRDNIMKILDNLRVKFVSRVLITPIMAL